MNSFALFRLPYRQKCTLMVQDGYVSASSGLDCLDDSAGFVIAPFDIAGLNTVFIRPEIIKDYASTSLPDTIADSIDKCCAENYTPDSGYAPTRSDYGDDFKTYHDGLLDDTFDKLVLARKAIEPYTATASPTDLFFKACCNYPRLFIALFSHPECGTWLVATPELLVSRHGDRCHTMALAGTMRFDPEQPQEWSRKNIEEQQYVTSYILDTISPFAKDIAVNGPHTVRAGQLVHLRSEITFTTDAGTPTSTIVEALHPTPAVCGLPKEKALRFILSHECSPRDYYSGFCGPCNSHGHTQLFVSLRCMRLCRSTLELFAGGGILKASIEDSEWNETQNKMLTMRSLIQCTMHI